MFSLKNAYFRIFIFLNLCFTYFEMSEHQYYRGVVPKPLSDLMRAHRDAYGLHDSICKSMPGFVMVID